MPMVNPFTPNAFKLETLTAAINNLKYAPGRIGSMGLFEEAGISTLDAAIEERDGVLSLLDVKPRGAPGTPAFGEARKIHTFRVPHIPQRASIMADEVQGVRAFGSENQAEVLQTRINERLATMRRNIDYTMELHRLKAIMGTFVDANGDDVSLFTTFGVTQKTQALGLHKTNASNIREKMFAARIKQREALDGTPWTGSRAICGDAFWSILLEDKDVKETYLNQQQAAELRGNVTDSFTAFGVTWEWYEGTSSCNLGSDAYLIPMGVPGLFVTRYAPANYVETVNTIGLPYYAKGMPMDFGKGWEMEAQANPINLCTRPAAVIKLTI